MANGKVVVITGASHGIGASLVSAYSEAGDNVVHSPGHGRSSQTADGHDMDHYAEDLAALTVHLDLREAIHIGHSTFMTT